MVEISVKSAIIIIQSMIMAREDNGWDFLPEQLIAYGELWNKLTPDQKLEIENGLADCYRSECLVQLKNYVSFE
jgi:hypothetical protein